MVTGTPGVGKTSVSKLLASKLGALLISLGDLIQKERLYSEVDEKRGSFVADGDRVSARIREMVSSTEHDVIVEGHFAPDVVDPKRVHMSFVLRRNPEDLKTALVNRGFRGEKLEENLMAEILDICLWDAVSRFGSDKVCEIDVTGRSVEEVAEALILVLKGKKECRAGSIDWLGVLEAAGRLDEYLRYL